MEIFSFYLKELFKLNFCYFKFLIENFMEIKKSEIITNAKNIFTSVDYLEISEDELDVKGKTHTNQEITKRGRSRSNEEEEKTKSFIKKDRHKHSKNNKYKRKRDRSKSRSSSDNSSRQIHKRSKIIKKKDNSSSEQSSDYCSSRSSSLEKRGYIPSSYQKKKTKTSEDALPKTQNENTIENSSKPNFFQEKKSKWSNVEEDESINKLREPRIIQVNPSNDNIKKDKAEAFKIMDGKDEIFLNNYEVLDKTNEEKEKISKNKIY